MTRQLKFTAIPLSIAQSIAFLAALLWFWCGYQMERSPTAQDDLHQTPFYDHGTTRYLTTEIVQAKRIAIIIGFASCGFTLLNLIYISRRTGRPMGEVFSRIRLFRSIEIESNKND